MAIENKKRPRSGDAEDNKKKPRTSEGAGAGPSKSTSTVRSAPTFVSTLKDEETDFPRGGGSSLTALELKQTRQEGRREAEAEAEAQSEAGGKGKRRQVSERHARRLKKNEVDGKKNNDKDQDSIRVEILNYKRLVAGTHVLARVHTVLPLHLILSLPNNLLAHVPITEISTTLTSLLKAEEEDTKSDDEDEDEDENMSTKSEDENIAPDLSALFFPGQYFPAKVVTLYPTASQSFISQYPVTETTRLAARVEVTLVPEKVGSEVAKADLTEGYFLVGEVKSEEDKGWRVGVGLEDGTAGGVEGWISKEEAEQYLPSKTLIPGQLIPATVKSLAAGGRVLHLSLEQQTIVRSQFSEVSTVGSIVPGHAISALITAVVPSGLNVKVCGFYDGTIDLAHLPLGDDDVEDKYKIGKKIRARVIYDNLSNTPRRFALSALPHVLAFNSPTLEDETTPLEYAIPIGKVYQSVRVVRVMPDWGVLCRTQDGLDGFVHISHLSDERVAVLSNSTGQYKAGTLHRARVIGHSPMDGALLFSFEQKVLDQLFMQVNELKIGQVLKGTINRLTDKFLFVNIHGSVDGIVFPTHYADISLKHPEKRFKQGTSVKARVFSLEPARNRVVLTLKKSLVDSDLEIPAHFGELQQGKIVPAVVLKIAEKGCVVELFGGMKAFMPLSESSQTFVKSLSDLFYVGKPINVRILEIQPEAQRIVVSAKQASASAPATAAEKIQVGESVSGTVSQVHDEQVVVKLSGAANQLTALLSLSNLSNQRSMGITELRESLKEGDKLDDLVVVSKNPVSGLLIVNVKKTNTNNSSLKEKKEKKKDKDQSMSTGISKGIKVGQIIKGTVIESNSERGTMVILPNGLRGRIHPCDSSDDLTKLPTLKVDQDIDVYVLAVNRNKGSNSNIDLSIRPSRISPSSSSSTSEVVDEEIETVSSLKQGQKVRGLVKNIAGHGVFVSLGRNVTARIMIKELFDEFVKDWESQFKVSQLVSGTILSVDLKKNSVEMTLRKNPTASKAGKKVAKLALTDYAEGQKVVAEVKKVEAYGIFLRIEGSDVSGLCHKSEISDNKKQDVSQALKGFREGDTVKAKILSIDVEKRKINFGIKASYFDQKDYASGAAAEVEDEAEAEEEEEDADEDEDEEIEESGDELVLHEDEDEDEDEDDDEEDDDEAEEDVDNDISMEQSPVAPSSKKATSAKTASGLAVSGGFNWTGEAASEASSSESESEDEEAPGGTTTKSKSKGKSKAIDLTSTAEDSRPESSIEFERALLSSPNSSFLWIQYMSFHLQLHEVEKARKIGRSALEKISYREEEEKLNVWMALINLELGFGTDESTDKVFKEAVQYNDARSVHTRYVEALQAAGKEEAVEEIHKKIIKKFSACPESWTKFAEYYLKKGDVDSARALLPRSMKSLDKSKHVETIEKMAVLEFKYDDAERGKTLFEGLVDRFPKRLDLWGVYIDQLAKNQDVQGVRGLVDRALNQKLTSKKAKFLFKKWLMIESRIGDKAGQEQAKLRAREWVEKNAKVDPTAAEGSDDE